MSTSILLAQVLGLVYLAIGLGMIMDGAYYHKAYNNMMKDTGLLYFIAITIVIAGFFLVGAHNYWVKSWEVLITIIAWGALIKGLLLLVVPQWFLSTFKGMLAKKENFTHYGFIVLVIGAVLAYYGFIA